MFSHPEARGKLVPVLYNIIVLPGGFSLLLTHCYFILSPHYVQTESLNPKTGEWLQYTPFVYADGTTNPPELLRDEPEMNYLSPSARVFGLALAAVALGLVFICALWVYFYRNHTVVIAAQPLLLYSLCLGSTMLTLAIIMSSFDESHGPDEDTLSRMCNANLWLDSLGHIIAFGALFTKVRIFDVACYRCSALLFLI